MTHQTTEPSSERAELKPCPFCGHVGLDFSEGSTFRWLLASCAGCGASCGEVRVQTLPPGTRKEWLAQAEADAIEAWNTRALLSTDAKPAVDGELPPLPRRWCYSEDGEECYTADQMRDYARAALLAATPAAGGGEAVAWMYHDGPSPDDVPNECAGTIVLSLKRIQHYRNERPLYTRPQPARTAEPLTDIDALARRYAMSYASPHHITFTVNGLRGLIEAAHGITDAPKPTCPPCTHNCNQGRNCTNR